MLLDRIDENSIAALLEESRDHADFPADRYDVYFQYNTASGTMEYLAIVKDLSDTDMPLGYYFSIGADLKVRHGTSKPWFPLLLFLRQYEMSLSEEKQKELYGEAYYTLGAVAGMTAEELAERERARVSFLDFLDRLDDKGLLNTESPHENVLSVQLELTELPANGDPLYFRMKIGEKGGKMYYIQNAATFCEALKTGREITIRPHFSVYLSPDAFEASWQGLMRHFTEYASSRRAASPIFQISPDHIPVFFSMISPELRPDAVISEDGNWTILEKEETASVRLDAGGRLILNPPLTDTKNETIPVVAEKQLAVLNPVSRLIALYHFDSPVHAELFRYFAGRTEKEISYVSDLIAKRIVPVTSGIMKKAQDNTFRITLHISLEGNTLRFETGYWLGDEKKDPDFFEGKPLEQALIRSYVSMVQSLHGTVNGKISASEDVIFFLTSDLEPLRQIASIYLDDKLKNLNIRKAPPIRIRASQVKGWLSLTFHSDMFTTKELEAIYAAYRKKKNFYLLRDNLILLDRETMAPVEEIIEEAGAQKDLSHAVLPFYHVMLLDSYREAGVDISMDKQVKDAIVDVLGYKKETLSLQENLKNVLRPYQADGVRWMKKLSKYGFSGILADDMGLGKTLEVLTFLSCSGFDMPVLIVCPKSLVYNWRNEIRKWMGDSIPVGMIVGSRGARLAAIGSIPDKGMEFFITGYDSLRLDIDAYQGKKFSLVLADEAQNVKNASTQKAQAIRKVEGSMHLALTGTPVENSLLDLWSIFDFLMPGYLGTEKDFREKYEPEKDQDIARATLAKRVSPFLLRRSKEEVLDSLPSKEVVLVTVSMADEQRKVYEAYLHQARELIKTEKGVSVFSALTRLRQICVDPSVFLEDYLETSAKLSVALDQVMAAIQGGHRILVFSSFTRVLEHFRYYLDEKDIRSYYISGETPGSVRVEMADRFNREDRIKVMLISIKAGGTGLNLVGADTVIHLDPWWNFAVEEQATDRAYRIGQTKPVTVYKLIAHDSIEEKVVALQEKKRQASSDVVQTSVDGIDSLTTADIQFILA